MSIYGLKVLGDTKAPRRKEGLINLPDFLFLLP